MVLKHCKGAKSREATLRAAQEEHQHSLIFIKIPTLKGLSGQTIKILATGWFHIWKPTLCYSFHTYCFIQRTSWCLISNNNQNLINITASMKCFFLQKWWFGYLYKHFIEYCCHAYSCMYILIYYKENNNTETVWYGTNRY